MASKSINITDYRIQIPGKLSDDKKTWEFPILYSQNKAGKTMSWQIIVRLFKGNELPEYDDINKFLIIEDVYYDKIPDGTRGWFKVLKKYTTAEKYQKTSTTVINSGKNIGKANATNVFTQSLRDALSQYDKQAGRSGVDVTTTNTTTNIENKNEVVLFPPMLAQKLKDQKGEIDYSNAFSQYKFDGVRAVSVLDSNNDILIYSRKLNSYPGFSYLREPLKKMLDYVLKNGINELKIEKGSRLYIDGEIYKHGIPLQKISGAARGDNEDSETYNYHIYDCFIPTMPELIYSERKQILDWLFKRYTNQYLIPVDTISAVSLENVENYQKKALAEKYEGVMLRLNEPYVYSYNDYHSKVLLKLKPSFDEEYIIVGYSAAERGKASGALMWKCKTEKGDIFNVTPMGEIEWRKKEYIRLSSPDPDNKEKTIFETKYLGQQLTVRYDDKSTKGVPLRGRGVAVRNYE